MHGFFNVFYFSDHGISTNLLHEMNTENLKELCPHLGTRLIKKKKLMNIL